MERGRLRVRDSSARWSAVLAIAMWAAAAGCSGGEPDVVAQTSDAEPSPPSSAASTTNASTSTSSTSTTTTSSSTTTTTTIAAPTSTRPTQAAPSQEQLRETLKFYASFAWSGGLLLDTDEACFDTAIFDSPLPVRVAAEQLSSSASDPSLWSTLEPDVRLAISSAYIQCVDDLGLLRPMIVMGTINTTETACIAEAWTEELDADAIAASLAFGLQELEPARLESMVADVMGCWADPIWWIDDVAREIEGWNDFTVEQAGCVANRMVEQFGVEPVVRRRLLTINVLAMPDDQLAALDTRTHCGVDIQLATLEPKGVIGNCIANLFSEEVNFSSVSCDQPHSAEVLGIEDVSAAHVEFPGYVALQDAAADMCIAIAEGLDPNPELNVTWLWPSRETWERGDRVVSCMLVRADGTDFTGPSGIVV